MTIKLNTALSEEEKKQLFMYSDISIKLFVQSENLIYDGVEDGKEYTEIITNPNRLLGVGGLYLLELCDEPNEWYMGEQSKDLKYRFWGNYGDLATALASL